MDNETAVVGSAAPGAQEALRTYSNKERNAYLLGLTGQNVIYNIVGACLMYYLQFTILIPAMTVSIIFAVARVWDAFNDPMMGTLVDRTRSKSGKCVPYLRAVPIPIMIITILAFTSFGFYGDGSATMDGLIVFWAAFTYILWGMTYTIGDIPLWSVTAVMTEKEADRTKLLSYARIFAGIGGGAVMLSMQSLAFSVGESLSAGGAMSAAEGERWGFLIVAAIFALLGTAMFQPLGFVVKEKIAPSKQKYNLKDNFKIMLSNKPFRQILLSGVLGSTKMLIALVAMTLVSYYFASKNAVLAFLYILLLGGGFFLGQFGSMVAVPKLKTKFSTKVLYNYSNLLGVIPYVIVFALYMIAPHNLTDWWAMAICVLCFAASGIAFGIPIVLQSTMIASCVDYEEYKNGTRPDAVFFSGQTFIAKLQSGLATIISGLAYTVVGFSDSRVAEVNAFISAGGTPRITPEYDKFMMILFFIVSIPPAIGCILSVLPTWKYALDDKEHARILGILNERRHAAILDAEGESATAEPLTDTVADAVITAEVDTMGIPTALSEDASADTEVISDEGAVQAAPLPDKDEDNE